MTPRQALAAVPVLLSPALAQAATAVHASVSAPRAEVGEGVRIEVSALSDGDDSPENPRLRVPPGFSVQGPSVSSSQSFSLQNGRFEHRHGVTATWVVVGTTPGHYALGPATFTVGRGTVQSEGIQLEIVPQGSAPRRPQRPRGLFDPNDFDPFGMFQRMPQLPGLDDDSPLLDTQPEAPPEYQIPAALEPMAFLRATVTPNEAIVGQQVTLRIYAYAGRGPYDEATSSEPSRPDFLSQSIVDSSFKQPRHIVHLDGSPWSVVKLREIALFPLKAGSLSIGPMRLGFRSPRYPETAPGQGLVRFSKALTVNVREPPLAGRPPGYELGDVGRDTLTAEVDPRRVEAGDAVAATIRVEGTGNVPHRVKVPEQNGVDFLEPTITEGVTVNDSVIGGYRQFRYVVRLDTPGARELGDVTLPYFDTETGRYAVARASLGLVEVTPGKAPPPGSSAAPAAAPPHDPFAGVAGPRTALTAFGATGAHLADRPAYWALLLGLPLGVGLLRGAVALGTATRRKLAARSSSPAATARRALDDAKTAAGKKDLPGTASAIERALYGTIEARLGLKARAVLRAELTDVLERRGAARPLAERITAALDACDGLRFAAPADGGTSLVLDAERLVAELSRLTARAEEAS